jgi:hypothetical protein
MNTEIWKVAFETYEVSNYGNVRRPYRKGGYRTMKCSVNHNGYRYFQLQRENKRKNLYVHSLVAKVFIGERPPGLVIDHIDRNKLNNAANNLRYVTTRENALNTARVIQDIPLDAPNRTYLVQKRYKRLQREKQKQRPILLSRRHSI